MEYEIQQRNSVRRLKDRAHYDHESVHRVLDSAFFGHVGSV